MANDTNNQPTLTQTDDKVVSPTKYIYMMTEMMSDTKTLAEIVQASGREEHIVKENIHRYLRPIIQKMGELKSQLNNAQRALDNGLKKFDEKPALLELSAGMAKDDIAEVIEALDKFANPV